MNSGETRSWLGGSGISYIPSPQGDFLVVIRRVLVGSLTGPDTLRFSLSAPFLRSEHTFSKAFTLVLVRVIRIRCIFCSPPSTCFALFCDILFIFDLLNVEDGCCKIVCDILWSVSCAKCESSWNAKRERERVGVLREMRIRRDGDVALGKNTCTSNNAKEMCKRMHLV